MPDLSGPPDLSDRVSVQEAAARCGVAERTVRRWIESGRVRSVRTLRGARVDPRDLPSPPITSGHLNGHVRPDPDEAPDLSGLSGDGHQRPDLTVALEALRLVEKLQQQNLELAGRVGYLQAELTQARDRILALEPPKAEPADVEPTAAAEGDPEPATRRWWRRVWRAVQV
jgi:excisionase family DNA binding protein